MDSLNRLVTDFTSWDELNEYVGMKRSEPIDKYYKPMQNTATQKKRRGLFTEKLEEDIIYLLAFLFYLRIGSNGTVNLTDIQNEIRKGYLKHYGNPDEYIRKRSGQLIDDIISTTGRHADEPYYYSHDRARLIAEEEGNTAINHMEYVAALKGFTHKQWVTIMDGHERDTHAEVNGLIVPINDVFYVGGSIFLYPRDLTYDPDPSEYLGCRCSLRYIKK